MDMRDVVEGMRVYLTSPSGKKDRGTVVDMNDHWVFVRYDDNTGTAMATHPSDLAELDWCEWELIEEEPDEDGEYEWRCMSHDCLEYTSDSENEPDWSCECGR